MVMVSGRISLLDKKAIYELAWLRRNFAAPVGLTVTVSDGQHTSVRF